MDWMPIIPDGWECYRAKFVFKERNEKGNINSLQLLSPTQKYGVIPQSLYNKLSGMRAVELKEDTDFCQLKTIHRNDFCISLRSFQGGFEMSAYEGVVSPAYRVFFANKKICPGYYKYLFKEYNFIHKMNYNAQSLRDGKPISFDDFGDVYIPYPPLDEQSCIANYLDSKCAAIDEAIERHKKIIEKLNEYKVTFLTHVVTHGVNETNKYRNTSIAWAPIIPTHWRVVPVKRLVASIHSGKNITSEDIDANGEFPVYGGNGLRGYYTHFNCDGDAILIGRQGALAGNIHQVSGKYWATDHALITHNTEIVQMTYLAFLFEAMNLNQYAFETAAQPGLAASKILALPTILPPLKEQEKIVNVIKKQQQNIDVAKCRHQDIISKLEEYRKSIIYNAVTGKIDCRTEMQA